MGDYERGDLVEMKGELSVSIKPKSGMVLEYVTDIEAARRFYEDVVGLEVERYHPAYVQFNGFAIATDGSMSGNRERELYWIVDDAQAAFDELSRKAEISAPLRQMPFGKVFGIKGPNGEPVYLLEWARERPSQPASAPNSK